MSTLTMRFLCLVWSANEIGGPCSKYSVREYENSFDALEGFANTSCTDSALFTTSEEAIEWGDEMCNDLDA